MCFFLLSYYVSYAGDGKTHFIYNQIKFNDLHDYIVISVDESFSVFKTISRLRKLYERSNAKEGIGIFFNFTLFKVKVSVKTLYFLLLCCLTYVYTCILYSGPSFRDPSRESPPLLRDHNLHAPMHLHYKLISSGRPLLL